MFVDISYYKIQWFEVASEDDFHSDFCWEFAVQQNWILGAHSKLRKACLCQRHRVLMLVLMLMLMMLLLLMMMSMMMIKMTIMLVLVTSVMLTTTSGMSSLHRYTQQLCGTSLMFNSS